MSPRRLPQAVLTRRSSAAAGAVALLLTALPARADRIAFLHVPPESARPRADLTLSGSMFGARQLKRARCRYRSPGASWKSVELEADATGETFVATVPAADVVPPSLEYFCNGLDRDEEQRDLFASAEKPQVLPVREPPPKTPPPEAKPAPEPDPDSGSEADPAQPAPAGETRAAPGPEPKADPPAEPDPAPEAPTPEEEPLPELAKLEPVTGPGPRLALVAPSPAPQVSPKALAKLVEVLSAGLRDRGHPLLGPRQIAAAYRPRKRKPPACGEAPRCLAEVGRTAGAELVASASVAGRGKRTLRLLVVRVADAQVLAREEVPLPRPSEAELARAAAALLVKLVPLTTAPVAVAPPQQPATTPPQGATPPPGAAAPAVGLLSKARAAYEAMDYDTAGALATQALAAPGLDPEARLDAYLVQAASLAITSDPVAAEVPFRLLLRARPDFQLPESSSPKILGVFQKVQAEERVIVEQIRAVARKQLVQGMQLLNEPPTEARGGRALPFAFRLRDPNAVVSAFELPFRRRGEPSYSALALKRDLEGLWRGAIPAEWTASERGFVLEYYLVTRDAQGPLLTRGDAVTPLLLKVSPGAVERTWAKPVPRWLLWTGVAVTLAGAAATGGLGLAARGARSDYDSYVERGRTSLIDGPLLQSKAQTANTLSYATIGAAIGTGVLAVVTAIFVPFTQSAEPEAAEGGR